MRPVTISRRDKGDTIIEVIFAMTIFAFVAVTTLSIMNQGVNTAERSLETTLVRQQMDAQAEALRYIRDTHLTVAPGVTSEWTSMLSAKGQANASPYGVNGTQCAIPNGSNYKPFIVNARTAQVSSVVPIVAAVAGASFPPFPQVIYNPDSSVLKAYGLWIEAVPSAAPSTPADPPRFVDFHIRACWDGPGSSVPMTRGTIVRLYAPV